MILNYSVYLEAKGAATKGKVYIDELFSLDIIPFIYIILNYSVYLEAKGYLYVYFIYGYLV